MNYFTGYIIIIIIITHANLPQELVEVDRSTLVGVEFVEQLFCFLKRNIYGIFNLCMVQLRVSQTLCRDPQCVEPAQIIIVSMPPTRVTSYVKQAFLQLQW